MSKSKPKTTIRKPPVTRAMDSFVSGETASTPDVQTASTPKVQKSTRRQRRQVTVYLDPDLAKKLKIEAVETGKEMSEIAEAALLKHLAS